MSDSLDSVDIHQTAVWVTPGGLSFGVVMRSRTLALPAGFTTRNAKKHIRSVDPKLVGRYSKYWDTITPETDEEIYWRFIFAFLSVHTRWQANVLAYVMLRELPKNFTFRQLAGAIRRSKCGMIKRARYIWDFTRRFWLDPKRYQRLPGESIAQCRNRLVPETKGLGFAKMSFAMEMIFPRSCGVVCLDTHILKLFGLRNRTPTPRLYQEIEQLWLRECLARKLSSPMVRAVYWDIVQGFPDTRYWSFVFEQDAA